LDGVVTIDDHTGTFDLWIQAVGKIINEDDSKSSSSDNEHHTRPTFGLDHYSHAQIVDSGLLINNKTFTVTDNFWTHIPMQNLTVGEVQNFTATTYAPKTLRVMEFLFGVPEVGAWNKAETSIELHFDYNGEIVSNSTYNRDDILIDSDSLIYSTSKTLCSPDDSTPLCDRVSIELVFNESPLWQVLAVQAIDWKGRNNILYFNEGIDVTGDSLNPLVQKTIPSKIKYKGLQTIERVDKVENIWRTLDENEPISLYHQDKWGTFFPLEWRETEAMPDKIVTTMDRDHSEFGKVIKLEQKRAQVTYDKIVSNPP